MSTLHADVKIAVNVSWALLKIFITQGINRIKESEAMCREILSGTQTCNLRLERQSSYQLGIILS